MHLFLIRHGETEHNVAGLLAGVTDSKLTNHGVFQTQKLARYLIVDQKLRFTHIYASDLQRAFMTAQAIHTAQTAATKKDGELEVVKLACLREQDFGSLELAPWFSKRGSGLSDPKIPSDIDASFKPKETKEAMKVRADLFIDDVLVNLFALDAELQTCVAVVSHGLLLGSLWKALLARFTRKYVSVHAEAGPVGSGKPLEYLPSWTNTGYVELEIRPRPKDAVLQPALSTEHESNEQTEEGQILLAALADATVSIRAVNAKRHLLNLKRTRGGVGSAAFDKQQSNINTFFKKSKVTTGTGIKAVKRISEAETEASD